MGSLRESSEAAIRDPETGRCPRAGRSRADAGAARSAIGHGIGRLLPESPCHWFPALTGSGRRPSPRSGNPRRGGFVPGPQRCGGRFPPLCDASGIPKRYPHRFVRPPDFRLLERPCRHRCPGDLARCRSQRPPGSAGVGPGDPVIPGVPPSGVSDPPRAPLAGPTAGYFTSVIL